MLKTDIIFKEIDVPIDRKCDSRHVAPEMFKRGGANSPEEPIRFFHVIGKSIDMIVCEPCLIVANYVASQQKKKGKK